MQSSDNIGQLAKALSQAQGEMGMAIKDSNNPFFNSKYADLASVMSVIREPFKNHGLAVSQLTRIGEPIYLEEGNKTNLILFAVVETVLMHESGEWISSECSAPIAKRDPQGIGSALTYLRRYTLSAIAGVAPKDDDDGNAASDPTGESNSGSLAGKPRQTPKPQPPAPTAPAPKSVAELFGTGAAKEREDEIKAILGELTKIGIKSPNNLPWNGAELNWFCEKEYDKPLNKLDAEEVEVLCTDFMEQLKEARAMQNQETAKEPEKPAAPAPVSNVPMAKPAQVTTLQKLCDIKNLDEKEVMHKATDGQRSAFSELTEEEAKMMIKEVQKTK